MNQPSRYVVSTWLLGTALPEVVELALSLDNRPTTERRSVERRKLAESSVKCAKIAQEWTTAVEQRCHLNAWVDYEEWVDERNDRAPVIPVRWTWRDTVFGAAVIAAGHHGDGGAGFLAGRALGFLAPELYRDPFNRAPFAEETDRRDSRRELLTRLNIQLSLILRVEPTWIR